MKTRAMGIENGYHSIQFYLMTVLKVIFLFQQLHRQMVIQIQPLTILSEEPLVMNPENQVKFQLDFQIIKKIQIFAPDNQFLQHHWHREK